MDCRLGKDFWRFGMRQAILRYSQTPIPWPLPMKDRQNKALLEKIRQSRPKEICLGQIVSLTFLLPEFRGNFDLLNKGLRKLPRTWLFARQLSKSRIIWWSDSQQLNLNLPRSTIFFPVLLLSAG